MQNSSTGVRKRGHVYFVTIFGSFVYIFLRFSQEIMKFIYIYIYIFVPILLCWSHAGACHAVSTLKTYIGSTLVTIIFHPNYPPSFSFKICVYVFSPRKQPKRVLRRSRGVGQSPTFSPVASPCAQRPSCVHWLPDHGSTPCLLSSP